MAKYKGGAAVPLVLDGTGQASAVPLTLKNAKSQSGIELWYTGTTPTGYALMNASGTLKGALGISSAANDWIGASAADDINIAVVSGKGINFGALAGGTPVFSVFPGSSNATFYNGMNLALGSAAGTKIGTATTQKLGFWNAAPVVQQSVSGSRAANAALASLLTALATEGLIVDGTTA